MKEYKGETVLEQIVARLVPPNKDYEDCMCDIILTKRHLYVLEDNYDGTYEIHFSFPITQIESVKTVVEKNSTECEVNYGPVITELIKAILSFIAGFILLPQGNKNAMQEKEFFKITYLDEMGKREAVYFTDLQSGTRVIRNEFEKLKKEL